MLFFFGDGEYVAVRLILSMKIFVLVRLINNGLVGLFRLQEGEFALKRSVLRE